MKALTIQDIHQELEFSTSRSSGAGGQNVNKVNSKVTLRWNILNSKSITEEQKLLLIERLKNDLTQAGELIISSQEHRSQFQNKEEVIEKLKAMITASFKKPKTRKRSKPNKASVKKRLENKKKHSEKKQSRRKIE